MFQFYQCQLDNELLKLELEEPIKKGSNDFF